MTVESLIFAFFGGVFGATIGAIPSIGLTGFFVIIGSIIQYLGGGTAFLNDVAFGYFFGPHIAFAGAVAATAYLGKKNIGQFTGNSIDKSPFETQNAVALLYGGLYAIIGLISAYFFTQILGLKVDGGAVGIIVTGIITRIHFGDGKILSPHLNLSFSSKKLLFGMLYSGAFSAVIAWTVSITHIAAFGFGIGAFLFFFTIFGAKFFVGHHIGISAGLAYMAFQNFGIAILFGVGAWFLFELTARLFNTNTRTHIDPPAYAIAVVTLIIQTFFMR
ncbi:hypothetical protein KG089_03145 [Carnobacteriaceae bacterium zg-ZUI252]|nr:hypothetical protein [Carnobacteriaceae bacterium zg-ZUI252]MBS4770059.1 hypothetical protein [Carnobacteriaceae bacterium zg-ZUI240]